MLSQGLSPTECFTHASQRVYGITSRSWQAEIGCKLIENGHQKQYQTHLLVCPTGGGKSLVRDVCGLCFGGIILTIVPLLALGSDHVQKGNSCPWQDNGAVVAFHLDEIAPSQQNKLLLFLTSTLTPTTGKTIFLFSSPQFIVSNEDWLSGLLNLRHSNILQLIAIDEIHLFVHFALSFRKEFKRLCGPFLSHLGPSHPLLTTATCSERILHTSKRSPILKLVLLLPIGLGEMIWRIALSTFLSAILTGRSLFSLTYCCLS